jgi:MoxR-like ATPase
MQPATARARQAGAEEARQALAQIEGELGSLFYEREEVIRGAILAVVVRENVLLLGPPGCGKSELCRELCYRIAGEEPGAYFEETLTRSSPDDVLFGPLSPKGLAEDRYRRNTKLMLPEARVAFLDEIFKSGPSTLHALLRALNERTFKNDGVIHELPLELVMAASNELPEDSEQLEAFWDRLLLRYRVGPIKDPANLAAFLEAVNSGARSAPKTRLSPTALAAARQAAAAVDARAVLGKLQELTARLAGERIPVSVRRLGKCVNLVKAHAFLSGRTEAAEEDLSPLAHALWDHPEQAPKVRKMVMEVANPALEEARELLDEASEILEDALAAVADPAKDKYDVGKEALAKFERVKERLVDLGADAKNAGRDDSFMKGAFEKLGRYKREVTEKCLGIPNL